MDIQYLLWLQEFRNAINDAWTPFMEWVSMFATTYLIYLPILVYWLGDKKQGLYSLVTYYLCMIITPITKLTVCCYRPWIRDNRIIPAGDAITTATGYSFPSGHTTTAASLAGVMAVNAKQNGHIWVTIAMVIFILLTGFSRNYLGVHTPQDVFVGISVAVFSLIVIDRLFTWLDEHPEKENAVLLGTLIFVVFNLVYITYKPYPMDLTPQGQLIVDPQVMMNDGYGDLGKVVGFCIGRYIEKTWIRFKSVKRNRLNLLICALGLIPLIFGKEFGRPALISVFGPHFGRLIFYALFTIFYIALVPWILKLVNREEPKDE